MPACTLSDLTLVCAAGAPRLQRGKVWSGSGLGTYVTCVACCRIALHPSIKRQKVCPSLPRSPFPEWMAVQTMHGQDSSDSVLRAGDGQAGWGRREAPRRDPSHLLRCSGPTLCPCGVHHSHPRRCRECKPERQGKGYCRWQARGTGAGHRWRSGVGRFGNVQNFAFCGVGMGGLDSGRPAGRPFPGMTGCLPSDSTDSVADDAPLSRGAELRVIVRCERGCQSMCMYSISYRAPKDHSSKTRQ